MTEQLTKMVICCAEHDHATAPDCEHNAKEAIVAFTAEETEQWEADVAAANAAKEAAAQAAQVLTALKASARAKLVSGTPLTEEEAATLVI